MISTATNQRSGEIDALRGLAMLSVVALHAHLLPMGWIGVWLFYVISGFVVTQSLLRRRDETAGGRLLADFALRRGARIFPVYFAYLAVGLIATTALGMAQEPLNIASLALFFDNLMIALGLGRISGWPTGHLWTVSVEMQFYLLYGLSFCCLPPVATKRLLLALLFACPLARLLLGVWLARQGWPSIDAAFAIYVAPGLHFDMFAMGALMGFAARDGTLERQARPLALIGLGALALYAGGYVAVNGLLRGAQGIDAVRDVISGVLVGEQREAWVYSAVGLAMSGLVALAATRDRLTTPLLRSRILQRIGVVSYGGYLFRPIGLLIGAKLLSIAGLNAEGGGTALRLFQFLIGTGLTLLLAEASFRWLETPCRHWIETFGRTLAGRARPMIVDMHPQ